MTENRILSDTLLFEKKNKISGGIYNKMQVDFAYNSNHIEGSRLSHEQTRYIFETHSIEGAAFVNDVFEAANHFKCFDFVLDTVSEPITEEYIKKLHYTLKNGLITDNDPEAVIGDHKKYANAVGEIETAKPKDVHQSIMTLLKKYQAPKRLDLYDIAQFHTEFEKIHPFYDGNGRVGRLIILKMCLENDIVPFYINAENKLFYYKGLKEWQLHDKPNRLLDVFLSMQDDMKSVLDYFEIKYNNSEITSRELIAKHCR
ncbi:MAG: Fic family protein [Huintestinicola sp.]|uniref:Fic family protein n=1 Tax=Huintestinicola sp. TaxID=2981661 RepID=UPI003F05DDD2